MVCHSDLSSISVTLLVLWYHFENFGVFMLLSGCAWVPRTQGGPCVRGRGRGVALPHTANTQAQLFVHDWYILGGQKCGRRGQTVVFVFDFSSDFI